MVWSLEDYTRLGRLGMKVSSEVQRAGNRICSSALSIRVGAVYGLGLGRSPQLSTSYVAVDS